MSEKCWLPKLEFFEDYATDWDKYQDSLYTIFKEDFITSKPSFAEKVVNIRKHPIEFNKEEAFFHITCQDTLQNGERTPDFRRCERIRWVRAFIENHKCDLSTCDDCEGVKIWKEPYKNTERVHILLEEEKYMVVLELRESYVLLITAFYFDYNNALRKKLKNYESYKNK